MADVADPPPPRLQVGMSTRQCGGRVVVALAGELDVTDAAHIVELLTTVAIRVPSLTVHLTGLMTGGVSERRRGSRGSIAPASRAACCASRRAGYRGRAAHCQARTPAGRRAA
jgi:hypothetical protein